MIDFFTVHEEGIKWVLIVTSSVALVRFTGYELWRMLDDLDKALYKIRRGGTARHMLWWHWWQRRDVKRIATKRNGREKR